jgi:hypothetical protein
MFAFYGKGQINMNSTFGFILYTISRLDEVNNIFEVGSWNGQGSTVCIMNAIIHKDKSKLYSLEADTNNFNLAKKFWSMYNTNDKLHLANGTLHKHIANDLTLTEEERKWYINEEKIILNSNLINIDTINDIDFIILDGGEYTTQGDFDILIQKKPKYIALDDVNVYKCNIIRKKIIESNEWYIISENLKERNGWSVFKRKKNE